MVQKIQESLMSTVIQVAVISDHHRNAFLLLNMRVEQHMSLKQSKFDFCSLNSADSAKHKCTL